MIGLSYKQHSPSKEGLVVSAWYPLFGCTLLYLLLAPTTGLGLHLRVYDEQRVGEIILLCIAGCSFLLNSLTVSYRDKMLLVGAGVVRSVFFVIAGSGLVSALLAPLPRWALLGWATWILLALFIVSVAQCRFQFAEYFDDWLIGALAACMLAYSVHTIGAYAAFVSQDVRLNTWDLLGGFSNPRFFGQFQTMTLPLVVVAPLMSPKWGPVKLKYLLWFLAAWWWTLSIASGTRGTWLGLGVATVIVLAFCQTTGKRWVKLQVLALAGGIALYAMFFDLVPAVLGVHVHSAFEDSLHHITGLSGRGLIWMKALEMVRMHPFLGVGPMHFAYYPNPIAAHPHNALLQWAAEWGLPSALLTLGLIVWSYAKWVRFVHGSSNDSGSVNGLLKVALLASLTGGLTQALVDGVFVTPYSQTLLATLAGWACGWHHSFLGANAPETHRMNVLAVSATGLVAVTFLIYGIYPEITHLNQWEQQFLERHPQASTPRFWQQGWIYDTQAQALTPAVARIPESS